MSAAKPKRRYVKRHVAWLDPDAVRAFNRDAQKRYRAKNYARLELKRKCRLAGVVL